MPTIRQSAALKKRIAFLTLATGAIGTMVLLEAFPCDDREPNIVFFIPVFAGLLAMVVTQFIMKCQACGGDLAATIMASGTPISVSKKIRFCPCCGISIDTEIAQCKGRFMDQ